MSNTVWITIIVFSALKLVGMLEWTWWQVFGYPIGIGLTLYTTGIFLSVVIKVLNDRLEKKEMTSFIAGLLLSGVAVIGLTITKAFDYEEN